MSDVTPAQAPDTSDTPPTDEQPNEPLESTEDPVAEVERLRAELAKARKWEERAKGNAQAAKELDRLRRESMTEQERAVAEAREAARAEVFAELGAERVADAVRVAAAGRSVDVDALLDGLDASRFVGDDGQPDREAIASWIDRIAPQPDEDDAPRRRSDLGQGTRGTPPALNGDVLLRDLKNRLGI